MKNIEVGEPELASARVIDFQLRALARRRAADDYELGRWLVAGFRRGVHVELGFGSFGEYVHRLFGFSVRATEERVRTAAALEALPSLAGLAAAGALVFSVLRSLTRVATAETEAEWIEWVTGKTAREVEDEVRGRGKGDLPRDKPSSEFPPKRVILRLSPRAHALFTELRRALDDDPEEPLSDDALVEALASPVLRPPSGMHERAHVCANPDDPSAHVCADADHASAHGFADAGQPSYQIALIVCEHCREKAQLIDARGWRVPPPPGRGLGEGKVSTARRGVSRRGFGGRSSLDTGAAAPCRAADIEPSRMSITSTSARRVGLTIRSGWCSSVRSITSALTRAASSSTGSSGKDSSSDERPDRVAGPLVPYRRLPPNSALRHGGGGPEPSVAPA